MNNAPAQHAGLAVRASDAEREQAVALLQRSFADGRLHPRRARGTSRCRLRGADQGPATRSPTADLPAAGQQPPRPGMTVDLRLLIILLCVCPPAGMAYWLLSLRQTALLRAWLRNARPWQRLLAGAVVAGAGVALEVLSHLAGAVLDGLSHLAGAVLVSAGVFFALPAISGPLHRTWVIVRRACPVRGSPRRLAEQPGPDPGDCAGDRTPGDAYARR